MLLMERVWVSTRRSMTLSLSNRNHPQLLPWIPEGPNVVGELTKEKLPRLVSSVSMLTLPMTQSAFVVAVRSF